MSGPVRNLGLAAVQWHADDVGKVEKVVGARLATDLGQEGAAIGHPAGVGIVALVLGQAAGLAHCLACLGIQIQDVEVRRAVVVVAGLGPVAEAADDAGIGLFSSAFSLLLSAALDLVRIRRASPAHPQPRLPAAISSAFGAR